MAAEFANPGVTVALNTFRLSNYSLRSQNSKEVTKLQHSYEFVKEEATTEVRQTSMFTGDFYTSRRIFHPEEILTKG